MSVNEAGWLAEAERLKKTFDRNRKIHYGNAVMTRYLNLNLLNTLLRLRRVAVGF
ncbi:MAG: hypothetical protein WCO56_19525 [Verrucomicrobiota bacterium]